MTAAAAEAEIYNYLLLLAGLHIQQATASSDSFKEFCMCRQDLPERDLRVNSATTHHAMVDCYGGCSSQSSCISGSISMLHFGHLLLDNAFMLSGSSSVTVVCHGIPQKLATARSISLKHGRHVEAS